MNTKTTIELPVSYEAPEVIELGEASLLTLGAYSMVIYLLNTPFIGLVKGAMLKVFPWDGVNFLIYAPVLTLAGTLLPILLKRHVLSRVPALDRMTS